MALVLFRTFFFLLFSFNSNIDQLRPSWIINFIPTQTNFSKYAYHFFHKTLIITQILTTTNKTMLSKMHYFLHFHVPHSITSVTYYHSHYIIIQMITNYAKLGLIISLHQFTKNSSQLSK